MLSGGRRLGRDDRGVAAVEFALLLPILMLLYFGVVELTQGAMTAERAAHTASTIGDLVAQNTSVTSAEVADIFSVGDTVMYPYPTTTLQMRVSSLAADTHGNVTVVWSQALGMAKRQAGVSVSGLPANVINANESVVMSETKYTYASVFGQVLPSPITFSNVYYLHPRLSPQVTCADC
ncbi:MAG TPA: TadE/TadG family type IV pilus assembly protein [Caulobacteraceae bacterium]|nr:TadE/TadG family type IV pilus assembly protein [Caulobacteraceae bacterium]